jgi:uncharacterized membrane protein
MGLPENTASGLAYLATFVTGAIFFLLDRRPEVRFHAMIDIFPFDLVLYLAWLAGLITWVVLLIQGFTGNHLKLPFIGDLAEQRARDTS